MKMISKVLSIVLALALCVSMVAMAETYKVGTNPEFPPFESIGDDGSVVGIDVDIMTAIMEKIGEEYVIESMDFDALIPSLVSGKIDIAIAGMTNTEERRQSVLFSVPYYNATQSIIVKAEGSAVAGEADLSGKKIGVQLGTTGDLYCSDTYTDATIERYNRGLDAVQDLVNGRLDCVVIDEAPAGVFVQQAPGLVVLSDRLSEEVYSIAMPLEATELCAKIDEALEALIADGTIQAIVDSYK